jgi:integrase
MSVRAFLRRSFEPALRKAGIVGASWHTLRHTAASRRVMAGVDLVAVKELLGHRDIQTTLRYSHMTPGHLQEAVNKGSLVHNRDLDRDRATTLRIQPSLNHSEDDGRQGEELVRPEGFEPPALRSVV